MDKLRALQLKEVEMLKETISFFENYNLRFYAMSGTLLGAVRHKGFIPWDDDIDLAMPRPDYNKLLLLAKSNEISIKHYESDKSYSQYFAKIESEKIKVVIKNHSNGKIETTCSWISVFPFDGTPNHTIKRTLYKLHVLFLRMLYVMARFNELANLEKKNRSMIEKILIFLTKKLRLQKIISKERTFKRIDKLLQKYSYDDSDYVVDAMGAYKFKEMYPRKWFGNGQKYEFEGVLLNGPDEYDPMLTQLYGDYMVPPTKSERGGDDMEDIEFLE